MSESTRTRSRSKSRHAVSSDRPLFPVWAPPLVMVAVTITGLILAAESGTAPMAYFILFAVACVVCTILVEPRGLFLTVVAQPLYFLIGALAIGWLTAQKTAGNNTKTKIVTAVYPTIEHFLWLLLPFLISVFIAVVRWRRHRRLLDRRQQADVSARRKRRTSDDSNRAAYSRTRRRAEENEDDETSTRSRMHRRAEVDEDGEDSVRSRSRSGTYNRRESRSFDGDDHEGRHGGGSHTHSVEDLIRRSEERRAARAERARSDRARRTEDSRLPESESEHPRTRSRHSLDEDYASERSSFSRDSSAQDGAHSSAHRRSPLPRKRAPYLDDEFTIEDD